MVYIAIYTPAVYAVLYTCNSVCVCVCCIAVNQLPIATCFLFFQRDDHKKNRIETGEKQLNNDELKRNSHLHKASTKLVCTKDYIHSTSSK